MNTRKNAGIRFEEASLGGNQAPPQARNVGVQMHVHPNMLTDRKVGEALAQMAQFITTQAQDFIAQGTREGAP